MKQTEVKELKHGLYKLWWKTGGCSLASVGSTHDGSRWYAPCNWTSQDNERPMVASTDWIDVDRVELIKENNYEKAKDGLGEIKETKEPREYAYGGGISREKAEKTFQTHKYYKEEWSPNIWEQLPHKYTEGQSSEQLIGPFNQPSLFSEDALSRLMSIRDVLEKIKEAPDDKFNSRHWLGVLHQDIDSIIQSEINTVIEMKNPLRVQYKQVCQFKDFEQWVDMASSWIGGHSKKHQVIICIDKSGHVCHVGQDFAVAEKQNFFPITVYRLIRAAEAEAMKNNQL
jgi:hypothetical protein